MDNDIMEVFRFYFARDLMLEATNHLENRNEQTLVESENEEMETESVMHDNNVLSICEQFFSKFKCTTRKDVYVLFEQFKTDGIEMNKIDLLIMQKSKLFFKLEKKRGQNVNMAGLMFSEEESVSGWINRFVKDIKFKMPKTFAELEMWDIGHMYECFHKLESEVINAETRALHYSAHIFHEKADVENKLLSNIQDFAFTKHHSLLKMGKLANSATQKTPNYELAAEEASES